MYGTFAAFVCELIRIVMITLSLTRQIRLYDAVLLLENSFAGARHMSGVTLRIAIFRLFAFLYALRGWANKDNKIILDVKT